MFLFLNCLIQIRVRRVKITTAQLPFYQEVGYLGQRDAFFWTGKETI